jgi:hypothetical protein
MRLQVLEVNSYILVNCKVLLVNSRIESNCPFIYLNVPRQHSSFRKILSVYIR